MTAQIGLVTIGQSPRVDLTPDLARLLPGVRFVERGALDGLSQMECTGLAPEAGEEALVTRLSGGLSPIWPSRAIS